MYLTDMEKTMIHLQEMGLRLNGMKNSGVKTVSIDTYEDLLDCFIELLSFVEKVNGRLKV